MSSLTDLILVSAYYWKIPNFVDCHPLLIPNNGLSPPVILFVPLALVFDPAVTRFDLLHWSLSPIEIWCFLVLVAAHQIGFFSSGPGFPF